MKEYNVAVLGATGAVGQQMMKVLEERNFPVKRLLALASARSAGKQLAFRGEALSIEEATEASFAGMDIVLGAVSNEMAKRFAPAIQDSGAVFIDNSSAFRLREDVPLVVPEINPEDAFRHRGIIANPNCSTIITMVALGGIRRLTAIDKMVACTYQAVSGAGSRALRSCRISCAPLRWARRCIHRCSPARSCLTSSRKLAASAITAIPPRK